MKQLVWGCAQMLLGVQTVLLGVLLYWMPHTADMGESLSLALVLISIFLLICGIVTMIAGYWNQVCPSLHTKDDNK